MIWDVDLLYGNQKWTHQIFIHAESFFPGIIVAIFKQTGLAMAEPEHFGSTNHLVHFGCLAAMRPRVPTCESPGTSMTCSLPGSKPTLDVRKHVQTLIKLQDRPIVTVANFKFEEGKST